MAPFHHRPQRSRSRRRRLLAAGIALPADESPHPSSWTEWWYFTGHLTGTDIFGDKHSYGFEDVVVAATC
jgi:predicted secreted hydrolase